MANQIYANIYSQLVDEGREIFQSKGIIDHNKDGSALTKETGFTLLKEGQKKCKPTTHGQKVLVGWRYDTTTWVYLKDVKGVSPIELSDYTAANKIDDETAFAWQFNYVFKKRDRIIANTKTKYWKTTHKYGVRLPNTAAESLELDRQTGQTLWEII